MQMMSPSITTSFQQNRWVVFRDRLEAKVRQALQPFRSNLESYEKNTPDFDARARRGCDYFCLVGGVVWADGAKLYAVESPSLKHALEFEKQNYR